MTIQSYYYGEQFKHYALQFNAIFGGMQVSVGKNASRDAGRIAVPIVNASMDRVAAAAATGHTQNKHIRLPIMASNLSNFEIARDRMKGTGTINRQVYTPIGGATPDDSVVAYSRMPVPYDLLFDLHIYSSNKDQQFQIMEQIFIIFDPILQIQTSDAPLDWARIVTVELISVNPEENFPPATDSRMIMTTIQFKVDAYLSIPTDIRDNIVKEIFARISMVNNPNIGTVHSSGSENESIPFIFDEDQIETVLFATSDIDSLP